MGHDGDKRGDHPAQNYCEWTSLSDAVLYLIARGDREDQAKLAICDAIAEKRVLIRAHGEGDDGKQVNTEIYELNDIDISGQLNPNRLDWPRSRTAALYPWRIRSVPSSDSWEYRNIVLIDLNVEDLVVELCNDLSYIRLPDTSRTTRPLDSDPDLQWVALSKWSPSQWTVDALNQIAHSKTISLSHALSIMVPNTSTQRPEDEKSKCALRQQAARALCDAAWLQSVVLRGSRQEKGDVKRIQEEYFEVHRCLASAPNSIERDYERGVASSGRLDKWRSGVSDDDPAFGGREVLEGPRLNVEVEVEPLLKWLDGIISAEREAELQRRRSHRLYMHPFWSMETVLCWIAFRDSDRLRTRRDETKSSLERNWLEAESQPEIRLLNRLQAGRLRAFDKDQPVPSSYWEDCAPSRGCLNSRSPPLRLARNDVLRNFPVRRDFQADVTTRRESKIERIAERMRRTRKWISCVEIADWCTRGSSLTSNRESGRARLLRRMEDSVALGEFHSAGRSRLRLLHSDTSVVRLPCKPLERNDGSSRDPFVSVPHYLAHCWLPNEICRLWFQEQNLVWPAHFEKFSFVKGVTESLHSAEGSSRDISTRSVGRPSDSELYLLEYERRRDANELFGDFKEIAVSLETWGRANAEIQHKIVYTSVQRIVRQKYPNWRSHMSKY